MVTVVQANDLKTLEGKLSRIIERKEAAAIDLVPLPGVFLGLVIDQ